MKITNTTQNNDKHNNSRKALGLAAGTIVGLAPLPVLLRDKIVTLSPRVLERKKERLLRQAIAMDSFNNIKKHADEIIIKTGLKEKDLKIENKDSKKILQAAFNPKNNTILLNDKTLFTSVFREIGHALNFHNGGFTKALLKTKQICSKIVPLIGISGLFVKLLHNKKTKKNKPFLEKVKDFYSDNAALILCSAYVPILLEEGIASKKALKLAKPYLTNSQNQKHLKLLTLSFLSCMMIPVLFASATNLGVATKNKITEKK